MAKSNDWKKTMGKRSQIRRAVLRNPKLWYYTDKWKFVRIWGAQKLEGSWKPTTNPSYKCVVKNTLYEIGILKRRKGHYGWIYDLRESR